MNVTFFILGLFFSATGLAKSRLFYARVNGTFQRLSQITGFRANVVCLHEETLPNVPPLTLKKGMVTVMEKNISKTLSVSNGVLIFRESWNVEPFKVQLAMDSRVKNINAYACKYAGHNHFLLMNGISKLPNVTCSSVDIYLMKPGKVKNLFASSETMISSGKLTESETMISSEKLTESSEQTQSDQPAAETKSGSSFLSTVLSILAQDQPLSSRYMEDTGGYIPLYRN